MADDEQPDADELAARRGKAIAAPSSSAVSRRGSGGGGSTRETRPPLWRWFSTQVVHSDPVRAAAARHVRERWDLPTMKFSKIDRALATEESEHLLGFRQLLDEYRVVYEVADDDSDYVRETGIASLMLPFAPERCEQCNREAVPGTGACARHGGQWLTAKDLEMLSRRLRDRLFVMSETALRVLQDLMDNGKSEQVRMLAATAVLDRAGIGPHMNINHSGDVTINERDEASRELRARLERIKLNQEERDRTTAELLEANTVDAEIVDEQPA